MSQLTKIKVIAFMIIFTIICADVTYLTVQYVNNKKEIYDNNQEQSNKEDENRNEIPLPIGKQESSLPDNSYLGIVLGERYFENNIQINKVKAKEENLDYEYYEIAGLKDRVIQEKINKEIKDIAMQEVERVLKTNDKRYYFYTNINANFNNVLSLTIDEQDLNYDLSTGEKIKFTDLFTNNSEGIVWNFMKNTLKDTWLEMQYYQTGEYDEENNKIVFDQSGMDEYLLKMYNYYMANKENLEFRVGTAYIVVNIDEDVAYISMQNMYKNIAVYKKYLTEESIFEKGNLPKEKFCMISYVGEDEELFYLDEYNGNLFVNANIDIYKNDLGIILEYYKGKFDSRIQNLKDEADNNKDMAKYVFGVGNVSLCYDKNLKSRYNNLLRYTYSEHEYTMDKDEYINNFRDKMFMRNLVNPYNPIMIEYNKDKVSYKNTTYEEYNYVDKQYGEIKKLKLNEVFVPEYDYVSIMKEKIKQQLNDYMVAGSYYLEEYGKEVLETAILELEKANQMEYSMKFGIIRLEYNLLYNTIIGYFEGEQNTEGYSIYISDVLDFNYLK